MLRYVLATAGRSALRRALPLYLSTGIVSFVLFAGQGLDARTVTGQALESLPFRAVLLGLWLLGTLPAARAWLRVQHPGRSARYSVSELCCAGSTKRCGERPKSSSRVGIGWSVAGRCWRLDAGRLQPALP